VTSRALLLAVGLLAGCASATGRVENGVFHSAKGYRVTLPAAGWTVERGPAADLSLQADRGAGGMLVDATCAGRERARSLDVLARHLTFGLTRREVVESGTVTVAGREAARSVVRGQADGREVTTVEGLEKDGTLDPVQEGFYQEHGLQCGFCTPGMMLTGSALLAENPSPSEDEVRWAISGNICRCTGYMNIVKAIQAAGRDMAAGPAETADATVAS